MGLQSAGIFGPISGRVGDNIGYIKNGKQYWRRSPKKTTLKTAEINVLDQKRADFLTSFMFPFRYCYKKSTKKVSLAQIKLTPATIFDFKEGFYMLTEGATWDGEFSNFIFCTNYNEDFLDPKVTWHSKGVIKLTWNLLDGKIYHLLDFQISAPEDSEDRSIDEISFRSNTVLITLPNSIDASMFHLYDFVFVSADGAVKQHYIGTLAPIKRTLKAQKHGEL